ncbi:SURP and G-patch domain-containing protein 1-like isoform X2 [Palaemon carinicauda]|uniref:SURP and G-patch domain-containing protein 1-like isoform X2 n=1 Tax=Palaemon carinicauda TaxID=392227 RepID=UPI0035B5EE8B
MNANFCKYPAEDRVKEMSKQEEILLKRKREIERRLGLKEGEAEGEIKEEGRTQSPAILPNNKHVKINLQESVPVKPKADNFASRSLPMLNKFSNDGSFFEQFKRLTEKQKGTEGDIGGDRYSASETLKISPKPAKPNKVPLPKYRHPAFLEEGQDTSTVTEFKTEYETNDNGLCHNVTSTEGGQDMNHPDWFKEALKKVQEKARQLNSDPSAGSSDSSVSPEAASQSRKRKSRWAETAAQECAAAAVVAVPVAPQPVVNLSVPANLMTMVGEGEHIEAIRGVMVTRITRNSPAIYAYAHKVFGSLDLTEAQWKQCEEQMKMNVVFQLLQAKQKEADRLERQGKVKYEYDSDEDVDGGTWEHKRRAKEMAETQSKAQELTHNAEGKHHIGDFLPPDELARFMEKYRAIKEGRDPDLSDYQDHKLTEDNIGYKMLKSMGWTEGMGLGAEGKGITTPVNQTGRNESQGLGVERPDALSDNDDEYDAYRKRMMLAYRFRPNPLNNPRRAYY